MLRVASRACFLGSEKAQPNSSGVMPFIGFPFDSAGSRHNTGLEFLGTRTSDNQSRLQSQIKGFSLKSSRRSSFQATRDSENPVNALSRSIKCLKLGNPAREPSSIVVSRLLLFNTSVSRFALSENAPRSTVVNNFAADMSSFFNLDRPWKAPDLRIVKKF